MPKNNIYQNSQQDIRLANVEKHIEIINRELGDVRTDIYGIRATQKIILAFIMMIFGGLIGLFFK